MIHISLINYHGFSPSIGILFVVLVIFVPWAQLYSSIVTCSLGSRLSFFFFPLSIV